VDGREGRTQWGSAGGGVDVTFAPEAREWTMNGAVCYEISPGLLERASARALSRMRTRRPA